MPSVSATEANMRSSAEQALDILRGWVSSKCNVVLFLTPLGRPVKDELSIKVVCVAAEVNPVSLTLFGSGFCIKLDLTLATSFEWHDMTDSSESLKQYDSALEIKAPEYRCMLWTFKQESMS